ncbi:hypothetical protein I553_6077 [Mycobacterium xenopi 4042]|uniref:Uncharacterized protein n=1 Tax=Mycobacterium xenopi 4042 TaxID=1299334 RepID=X8BDL4_MYCXE|nr:hypothetical protein I553_6077 [Mycobacterium xenopi 4042]
MRLVQDGRCRLDGLTFRVATQIACREGDPRAVANALDFPGFLLRDDQQPVAVWGRQIGVGFGRPSLVKVVSRM